MATAIISNKNIYSTKAIKAVDYALIRMGLKKYPISRIEETVPFRVRFTNITVPGYGPNNIPGIGLQVIGYSNYIL